MVPVRRNRRRVPLRQRSRLLVYALAFSVASPAMHHAWFALQGQGGDLLRSFLVMAAGDLAGTLIVLYTAKAALLLARR
jgi:hypothetical protein